MRGAIMLMRKLKGPALFVMAQALAGGVAFGQTCADLDGDGRAETCAPSRGDSSGSAGSAAERQQELARIRQERYEAAISLNSYGERQMADGDLAGAIASFREALSYHGDNAIRRNLAFAEGLQAARNRDYATALAKFRRAISLDKANAGPVRAAMLRASEQANADGIKRYYAGDYAGALRLFKAALALTPGVPEILSNIAVTEAQIAAAKGGFGQAATKLDEAERRFPQSPRIREARQAIGTRAVAVADAALERGDKRGAQRGYRDVLALMPDNRIARQRIELLGKPPRTSGGGWQVFYSGNARDMFGAEGRGNFASKEECEAYLRSSPWFEQSRSTCSGPAATAPRGDGADGSPSGQASTTDRPDNSSASGQAARPGVTSAQTSPARPAEPATAPTVQLLSWRSPDFAPPSPAAHSACMLGTTASQNAVRRGELDYAARILRQVIPGCKGAATRRLLQFRLDAIDREIADRAKRAGYTRVANGLIGGTGWVFEDVYRDVASDLSPEDREAANSRLNDQFTEAGLDPATYMAAKDYEFILGLAVSDSATLDLTMRVLRDNSSEGDFSRYTRENYALLKGKHFDVLDCHSNGAMICLAALKNGDASARKVRLFGPQLSPDAVREWRLLLDKGGFGNKIEGLQIIIADGDPVPGASYLYSAGLRNDAPAFRDMIFGRAMDSILVSPGCEMDGLYGCYDLPAPEIIRLNCDERPYPVSIDECHSFAKYRRKLDAHESR